jgi:Archaeal/vacuolar-type H+-ATPase subunit D
MAAAKEGIDRLDMLAEVTPKTANVAVVNRGLYMGLEVENYGKYPVYSLMAEAPELDLALVKMRELLPRLISFAEKETLFYTLLNKVREYQTHDKRHRLCNSAEDPGDHQIHNSGAGGAREGGLRKAEDHHVGPELVRDSTIKNRPPEGPRCR